MVLQKCSCTCISLSLTLTIPAFLHGGGGGGGHHGFGGGPIHGGGVGGILTGFCFPALAGFLLSATGIAFVGSPGFGLNKSLGDMSESSGVGLFFVHFGGGYGGGSGLRFLGNRAPITFEGAGLTFGVAFRTLGSVLVVGKSNLGGGFTHAASALVSGAGLYRTQCYAMVISV